MSRYVSSISKDGDSTTSICNLIQSLTKQQQQVFSYVENFPHRWNSLCFRLCPLFLIFSLNTTELHLAPSSLLPSNLSCIYTDCQDLLEPSLLQANSPGSLSLSSYDNCVSPLIIFLALCWTQFSKSLSFLYWGNQDWANWFAFW